MPEHFLNGAQVGASFEQVRCERVAGRRCGWTRVGIEPGLLGEPAEDEERAGAGERAAAGVQEHLGVVATIEERAAARQVAAQCLRRMTADRHDALLPALADHAHEAVVEVDAGALEADRLGDAKAGAVQQFDERLVAERARLRPCGGLDQAYGLAGRERLRQLLRAPRQRYRSSRIVEARAEQLLVAEEADGWRRSGGRSSRKRGRPPAAAPCSARGLRASPRRPACRGRSSAR